MPTSIKTVELLLPLVVVLTGGIASGKSAVSNIFKELDVPVIDTDIIARDLVQPGKPALQTIIEMFGAGYLLPDGNLNRAKLRSLVFSVPEAKVQLESILHPTILAEAKARISQIDAPYCVLVVPLYAESSNYDWVDRVLLVDVNEEIQILRVMSRDRIDNIRAKAIIGAQATREQRLAVADDIIENSETIEELQPKIEELHRKYLILANQSSKK